MEQEIWKDVVGYEGRYLISDRGNVISIRWGQKRRLKPAVSYQGYLRVAFRPDKQKAKNYPIHRLVAAAFLNNEEGKPCVNHKNGNKSDNKLENLEWCTVHENNIHARSVLGRCVGQDNGRALFTDREALFIRFIVDATGIPASEIAAFYESPINAITNIINGNTY